MGKSNVVLLFILFTFSKINAQEKAYYWITFKDKSTTNFSTNNPSEFLSEKSIARRAKQNIEITDQDLPIPEDYINSIKSFPDIEIHNTSKWMNAVLIKTGNKSSIDAIQNLSFVKSKDSIQPSGLKKESLFNNKLTVEPSKKNNISYTYTHPTYGFAYNQIHLHNGEILHQEGYSGEGMTIAIIDGGFFGANNNPGLQSAFNNNQIKGTKNFVDNGLDVYKHSTHGTSVLSCIAGEISTKYLGTCPKADFWLFTSEDVASESIIEEYFWLFAAEYADSVGVDVINTSLGYTEFDDPSQNHTYADMDGNTTIGAISADIAASKGMILFNSNGNSGSSSWQFLGTPADADSVIAVGATDPRGEYAFFSSLGPASDGDIKPNITGQGFPSALINNEGTVFYGAGTSFSGPILCGLGACLWQAFPDLSNMEIKKAIEESSHIYNAPDIYYGYGIPDFKKSYENLGGEIAENTDGITVYPTLFEDKISIELLTSIHSDVSIQIFNIIGAKLIDQSFDLNSENSKNFITINNLDFASGTYLLNVISNEKNYSFKLVKH